MTPDTEWTYLDNNATTKPAPEVVDAMIPYYSTCWGNPSSLHEFGRQVATTIDTARNQVAQLIGARRASCIVFTSSGTEADNLAIYGLLKAQPDKKHIVTSQVEHSAIRIFCMTLEKDGYEVTYLPVGKDGTLEPEDVKNAIRKDTACVALMWANNETGVTFPIQEIAKICQELNVPLHTDAVQAAGKIPIDVEQTAVNTLAISGHKIHAPKGVGALYIARGTPFRPMLCGGGQEHGRRSGTENVAQIVAMGVAAQLSFEHLPLVQQEITPLRDQLEKGLLERIPDAHINGSSNMRTPNTTNLSCPGADGEGLILALSAEKVAASTGSACSAGSTEPSHVLVAMKLNRQDLQGTLRLSLSRYTTAADIERALDIIPRVVASRRRLAPR